MHGRLGPAYLTVNPLGDVLPCPTASCIPSLRFENVRHRSLRRIWEESEAFNRFRSTSWMPEPCRSCDRREIDFGGCRCQAFLLTGDAANTDPACALSPQHAVIQASSSNSVALPLLPLHRRQYPDVAAREEYWPVAASFSLRGSGAG